jgi:hypothetical protein
VTRRLTLSDWASSRAAWAWARRAASSKDR